MPLSAPSLGSPLALAQWGAQNSNRRCIGWTKNVRANDTALNF
jgi:hypothetical protein